MSGAKSPALSPKSAKKCPQQSLRTNKKDFLPNRFGGPQNAN
jgi:hypothetical protein